jgi:hypothetical protein
VPFKKDEAQALLRWVARGGRLVVIDRRPDDALTPAVGGWRVSSELSDYPDIDSRPDDLEKMTAGVKPVAPAQPTLLTRDVATIQPSRFAGRLQATIVYDPVTTAPVIIAERAGSSGEIEAVEEEDDDPDDGEDEEEPPTTGGAGTYQPPPPPPPRPAGPADERDERGQLVARAPVVHVSDWRGAHGALLLDYAYGRGRIVVLGDPYIVSNAGIRNADNLQLAVNVVAGAGGPVAFDEFHQGLGGAGGGGALALFRGTPVLWLFAQAGVVVLAFLWSRGRRFARPLPAPRVDRRSKLEFVASMAELQSRARAYDLAVENVYARTRRALARYGGLDPTAPAADVAARVAARSGKDPAQLARCSKTVRTPSQKRRRDPTPDARWPSSGPCASSNATSAYACARVK